ncbi:MAG: MFS transporter [Henriciella sp.]
MAARHIRELGLETEEWCKMTKPQNASALRPWQRALYGVPYLGYSVATLPVVAFIPAFYESERGLGLAAVGLMIALTRVTDAITDPLVGWCSDRLRTPIGRRKPVILLGLPLLCLSVWMLFVPPADVSLLYVFTWAALLYLGFTLVDLPFKAFGAELSPYYDERAELAGWREGLGLFGTLLGLIAAAYIALSSGGGLGDQLFVMALIAIIFTPLLFSLTLGVLREPPPPSAPANEISPFAKARLIWRNGPFRSLLLISFVLLASEFGASALKALIFEHVFSEPDLFPVLLLAELLAMVASIPFWLWLSRRYSKHQAVAIAALWGGAISLMIPILGSGSLVVFSILSLLKATSIGAITVLVNGMAADVIDIDEARTRETRTGVYFALWGMVNKGAVAMGVLVATSLPGLLGYKSTEAGAEGALSLVWTFGLLPGIGFLAIAPVLFSWRLTRERQERIRAAIKRRSERLA